MAIAMLPPRGAAGMVLKREPTRVVADSAPRQGPKKAQQPQVDGIGGYDVAEEE